MQIKCQRHVGAMTRLNDSLPYDPNPIVQFVVKEPTPFNAIARLKDSLPYDRKHRYAKRKVKKLTKEVRGPGWGGIVFNMRTL